MPAKPNLPPEPDSAPVVISEEYKDLLGELDRPKQAWRPSPGDAIAGRVVAMMTAQSEYGAYPLFTLDPGPDGPLVDVHCFHQWLKSDVLRLEVHEGDLMGIKFLDRNGPRESARYRTSVRHTGTGKAYALDRPASFSLPLQESLLEEPF
jgi:hypothetical protein